MAKIDYSNNKKLQVEFTDNNLVEDSWMFLIYKFLDKLNFKKIAKKFVSVLNKHKWQKTFSNYDLFLQEIFMTLTWNRSLTNIKFLKENKLYDFVFENWLAEKSTLNNFQNSFSIKNSFELSQFSIELVKQNSQFLFSKNWMIILDFDAVDIETHWNQEWSFWHWYYRQTMFYPLVISVFDWLLPLVWRLRAWNSHWWNWLLPLLQETISSLQELNSFKSNKVLLRWDAAFWSEHLFSYAENNNFNYLIRISSNERLKSICKQYWFDIYKNENAIYLIKYKANSWTSERTIIVNIVKDSDSLFPKIQFFCTNLNTENNLDLEDIVDLYHKRWTSEHIFHDLKESFQSWKTSCHSFWANSYRFQVSLIAMQIYVLFRELYLNDSKEFWKAYYKTIFTRIFSLTWKLVSHAKKIILKIPKYSKKALIFMNLLEKLSIT